MQPSTRSRHPPPRDRSLRIILGLAWALGICITAFLTWHAAHLAHQHVSRLALLIHCSLAACLGMLAITWVEQRLERGSRYL